MPCLCIYYIISCDYSLKNIQITVSLHFQYLNAYQWKIENKSHVQRLGSAVETVTENSNKQIPNNMKMTWLLQRLCLTHSPASGSMGNQLLQIDTLISAVCLFRLKQQQPCIYIGPPFLLLDCGFSTLVATTVIMWLCIIFPASIKYILLKTSQNSCSL